VTANPWLVPITALRRTTGAQREEHRRGRLGELRVADAIVPADRDVDVDIVLSSVGGGVEANGSVRAEWQAACRRCLRPLGGVLRTDVREVYRPHAGGDDDEETYPLGSEHLDLEPLARDALLLALPLAPLCREDCAGLCPTCGADLADGPCGCAAPGADPRWAALDVLRSERPGGAQPERSN
jgi:uncharacterized protein